MKFKFLIGMIIIATLFVASCTTSKDQTSKDQNFISGNAIKDSVAAIVNGQEVSTLQVTAVQQTYAQQGQQLTEKEALEQAILQKLLAMKAAEKGYTVSDTEAEALISEQLKKQGKTLDSYKQQLAMAGVSYPKQLALAEENLAIQKYLRKMALDGKTFNVTEEETRDLYATYVNQSNGNISPYEDVKAEIKMAIQHDKENKVISKFVSTLRANADVEYK